VLFVQFQEFALAGGLVLAGVACALATAPLQIRGAPAVVPASLVLYTRKECALCDEARALLDALRVEVPFDLWEADVDTDPALRKTYGDSVPVAMARGKELFRGSYDEAKVRAALALRPAA
jgi:hypothetical protein